MRRIYEYILLFCWVVCVSIRLNPTLPTSALILIFIKKNKPKAFHIIIFKSLIWLKASYRIGFNIQPCIWIISVVEWFFFCCFALVWLLLFLFIARSVDYFLYEWIKSYILRKPTEQMTIYFLPVGKLQDYDDVNSKLSERNGQIRKKWGIHKYRTIVTSTQLALRTNFRPTQS